MITFLKHAQKLVKSKVVKPRPILQNAYTDEEGITFATDSHRLYVIKEGSPNTLTPLTPTATSDGEYPTMTTHLTPIREAEGREPNVSPEQLNALFKWLGFAKSLKGHVKVETFASGSMKFSVNDVDNSVVSSEITLLQDVVQEGVSASFDVAYLYDMISYIKDYKASAVLYIESFRILAVVDTPSKPSALVLGIRLSN